MTDTVELALIAAAPGVLASVLGLWNNILARRNETHLAETKTAIVTLEKNTNSIKDQLVASTGKEAAATATAIERRRGEDIAAAVKAAQPLPSVVQRQETDSKE